MTEFGVHNEVGKLFKGSILWLYLNQILDTVAAYREHLDPA